MLQPQGVKDRTMHKKIIEIALSQIGIKEVVGKADNPEVLKYFDALGHDGSKLKDETAWCAAFVGWTAKQAGVCYSTRLNARSYLHIGTKTTNPKQGDVAVLWREDRKSWKGHVGFYIREHKGWIYLLGGNQNNQVCIKAYPKSRLLEYRNITN